MYDEFIIISGSSIIYVKMIEIIKFQKWKEDPTSSIILEA